MRIMIRWKKNIHKGMKRYQGGRGRKGWEEVGEGDEENDVSNSCRFINYIKIIIINVGENKKDDDYRGEKSRQRGRHQQHLLNLLQNHQKT